MQIRHIISPPPFGQWTTLSLKHTMRKHGAARHLLMIFGSIILAATPTTVVAQNPNAGAAPVTVQNTSANPVPVAVANTRPLLLKTIDEPGRSPYQSAGTVYADGSSCGVTFDAVPANKRLVAKYFSAQAVLFGGARGISGQLGPRQGSGTNAYLSAMFTGFSWVVNQEMTVYFEAGFQPSVDFFSPGGSCGVLAALSGYLVDLSQ